MKYRRCGMDALKSKNKQLFLIKLQPGGDVGNKEKEIQKLESDNIILLLYLIDGKKDGIPTDELEKRFDDNLKKCNELRIEIERWIEMSKDEDDFAFSS